MANFEQLTQSYIGGKWVQGEGPRVFEDRNPYDNSLIASIPIASLSQVKEAFEVARRAQKEWAKSTAEQRREVLRRAADYLRAHREEIVGIICRETGGTLLKGNVEFELTLGFLEEAIKYADAIDQVREVPAAEEGKTHQIYRLPLGVISSISPFNFPMNLSMRTIAPAIALGNAVVHKPDIQVALSGGSIITKAFEEAGLPAGVLNMILTDIEEIGDEMLTNPHARLISFTGSSAVGRHVGEVAGRNLKRVALELGGNSPFVVLSDADVDRAVDAAVFGKFVHQGQICMIINRIIVHKDKYDEFASKFVERAKALPCGDPLDPKTVIGPIINERQMQKALNMIEEAKREGVDILLEGRRVGNVLTPHVFGNVNNSSKLAQTELFAPIATLIKAESDEEAIRLANETDYGLSSSIFSCDLERARELALQIESGMTHVNDQTVNDSPNIPFGGTKASGLGRFGNPWIIEEFTETKWVSIQKTYRQFPF